MELFVDTRDGCELEKLDKLIELIENILKLFRTQSILDFLKVRIWILSFVVQSFACIVVWGPEISQTRLMEV